MRLTTASLGLAWNKDRGPVVRVDLWQVFSMAHNTTRAGYSELVERLNRFPQGAPPSELLFKILSLLFSEREAELVSRLPIRPFTAMMASTHKHRVERVNRVTRTDMMLTVDCQMLCTTLIPT